MQPYLRMIFFWCILQTNLLAQQEASNWFFGEDVGIQFTDTGIVNLPAAHFGYNEGWSSISNCKGELQFYCDGETVWNKTNAPMVNGTGLLGHYSCTQGSIIVQQPGDCDQYYVFTLDAKEHGFVNGLQYHIVDMSLQNGQGEVTSKNNLLYAPAAEKLTAVRHSDGESVWVITHEMQTSIFRAYRLTATGLDTMPVLSEVGASYFQFDALGQMKASPDGRRIGVAHLYPQLAEVFDFDAATGSLSNPIQLPESIFEKSSLYGLEFSPKGNLLYIANHTIDYLNDVGYLYQFDLLAGSNNDIVNSATVVGQNVPNTDLRGLQLGPDGKLYVARSLGKYMGVVNNPDIVGLGCNYVDEGVFLGGNVGLWTLPNFMVSYFDKNSPSQKPNAHFNYQKGCRADGISFIADDNGIGVTYQWDFGDGEVASVPHPLHIYQDTGAYTVRLIADKHCCTDTTFSEVIIHDCYNDNYYIPTAFSPNGDGINDVFEIYGDDVVTLKLKVFDRWGEQVFESDTLGIGWDGWFRDKKMDNGVYVYTANIGLRSGKQVTLSGSFSLVK